MRLIFFCFVCVRLFSTTIVVPDLSQEDYMKYFSDTQTSESNFQMFNGEKAFCKAVEILRDRFNLTMAIETGTAYGGTTQFFGKYFQKS